MVQIDAYFYSVRRSFVGLRVKCSKILFKDIEKEHKKHVNLRNGENFG